MDIKIFIIMLWQGHYLIIIYFRMTSKTAVKYNFHPTVFCKFGIKMILMAFLT